LMRTHMYAVQYGNYSLAADTLGALTHDRGLDACQACATCRATCRNSVNIARKIEHLKALSLAGRLNA
jgi:succinate dehydrogenase/fumarate reductase-like Fe-S protein